MREQQKGITLLGFMIVLVIAGFFAFLAMRFIPVYMEYHTVKSAVNAEAEESKPASVNAMRLGIMRRLSTDIADSVKPEHFTLVQDGRNTSIRVYYEVRRPLAYNVEFIATFDHSAPIR